MLLPFVPLEPQEFGQHYYEIVLSLMNALRLASKERLEHVTG